MSEEKRARSFGLRDHEKFWAFVFLISAIVFMAWLGRDKDPSQSTTLRDAVIGLIGLAGVAGQALFRVSSTDRLVAETALETAKNAPPPMLPAPAPTLAAPGAADLERAVEQGARDGTREGVQEALVPEAAPEQEVDAAPTNKL